MILPVHVLQDLVRLDMYLNIPAIIVSAIQSQILVQLSIFMSLSQQLIVLNLIIHGHGILVKRMPMIMVVFITVDLIMMVFVIFAISIARHVMDLIKLIALLAKDLIICGHKDQIIANKVVRWEYIHGILEIGMDSILTRLILSLRLVLVIEHAMIVLISVDGVEIVLQIVYNVVIIIS
ncbi:hypothetical protein [Flavobacterium sp.]|uniref:hypothetical protein n=1 Tax=Flavobacterium sp. TaxID=239 RepID=UPI0037BEBC36